MSDWEPGRWWRVIYADERRYDDGRVQVWCETSVEREARAALARCPGGGVLQRLYVRSEQRWEEVDE